MPKKTTILILILAAVTGVLLFLAASAENQKSRNEVSPQPTKKVIQKTARIFFNPQNIDLSEQITPVSTVDIMIETGFVDISGVQIEAVFDPKAIIGVKLTPSLAESDFFGPSATVVFNDISQETGRISYAIAISPGDEAKRGIGRIATLYFQKSFNPPVNTTIAFLNKTMVTVLGETESVLKEAFSLNLTLSKQTLSPANPAITTPPPQAQ